MKSKSFIYILLSLFYFTCAAQPPEKGISKELAAMRKKEISNVKYHLFFRIPDKDQIIEAKEDIRFDLNNPFKEILIDYKSDAGSIHQIIVNGRPTRPVYINEHIVIYPNLLLAGTNNIGIEFISSGHSMKRNIPGLVYCLFVPAKAHECFPCFDQPDIKAKFQLDLAVPAGWLAVSNGTLADSIAEPLQTTWKFAETLPISSYLFSFAAGKLKRYAETREGRTINFYYPASEENKADSNLRACLDLNFKALAFNSSYAGSPYPFQKFDFVEIPKFSVSGMEHPGAIFYSGDAVFLNNPSASQQYSRSVTIGHEVSHMWFGDLVTMKWFNEVWLKEVFANYVGNEFANTQGTDSSFNKKFLLNNFPQAYTIDRFQSSDPIERELPNLNQAGLAYGEITYNKAPIMMHQLELLLGAENFKKAIQNYIALYRGGNADFSQLTEQFKKYSNENFDRWLDVWVKKPGRPVFYYNLDTTGGKIIKCSLNQFGEYNNSLFWPQKFDISLFYDSTDIQTFRIDMKIQTQELSELTGKKIPKFILFNSSGEGYGVFPLDKAFIEQGMRSTPVEARASAIINLYERMLRSKEKQPRGNFRSSPGLGPRQTLNFFCSVVNWEPDKQLLERELRYIQFIYWKLLLPETRKNICAGLEKNLLNAISLQNDPVNKTALFLAYIKIAETPSAIAMLFEYWEKRKLPEGVAFGRNDWTQLAVQLALRDYRSDEVLSRQLDSLKNFPEDHTSFSYQMKALSSNVAVRDSFFKSLLTYAGRKSESDIITSLQYLHHPLRQADSRKYIRQSLDILPDILPTNDVFFPPGWIYNILEYYHDKETVKILRSFLSQQHAQFPYLLLQKVRQGADLVFRAEEISE